MQLTKKDKLKRRHRRLRNKVNGTADRPRLYVRKSLRHLHAQLIDDSGETGCRTLTAFSTLTKETAGKHCCNVAGAAALGKSIGEELKKRGVESIVFDRGGNRYHGCVKALADAVRETGVRF